MAELPIDRGRATWTFVAVLLRLLLAAVFVFAALMKFGDLDAFAREIRAYQAVPAMWSVALANVVPWLEVVVAAFLVLGIWRVETRVMFLLMLVGFIALKVSAEIRGLKIECGCFGANNFLSAALSGWKGVLLNVVLVAMLGIEAYVSRLIGWRATGLSAAEPDGSAHPAT